MKLYITHDISKNHPKWNENTQSCCIICSFSVLSSQLGTIHDLQQKSKLGNLAYKEEIEGRCNNHFQRWKRLLKCQRRTMTTVGKTRSNGLKEQKDWSNVIGTCLIFRNGLKMNWAVWRVLRFFKNIGGKYLPVSITHMPYGRGLY